MGEAERLVELGEDFRKQMHETLVNHKREELLGSQAQSANLQKQLEAIALERDGFEAKRDQLLDEVRFSTLSLALLVLASHVGSFVSSSLSHAKSPNNQK